MRGLVLGLLISGESPPAVPGECSYVEPGALVRHGVG